MASLAPCHAQGHAQARQQQERREQEGRARKTPRAADGGREEVVVNRPGPIMEATPRSPLIAPWSRPCSVASMRLVMSAWADWSRESPQRRHQDAGAEQGRRGGEAIGGESRRAARQSQEEAAASRRARAR